VDYFFGTGAHNTIKLGDSDQMKRSGRFIWLHWSQSILTEQTEDENWMIFKGSISAFRHIRRSIKHSRRVKKRKGLHYWEIEDQVIGKPDDLDMIQIWHPHPDSIDRLAIRSYDQNDNQIVKEVKKGWHAPGYGIKNEAPEIHFSTRDNYIKTIIEVS
jgi:hypothetical protein